MGLLAMPSTGRAEDDTTSLIGKPAPDFTLQSIDGKTVKLSELKGNVLVLDFWATWCGPCVKSLPHLNEVAHDKPLAEKGLKVYAVNCGDTKAKVEKFLDNHKLQLNVLLDSNDAMQKDYLVNGIPATVIVGRDGAIKKVLIGFEPGQTEKELGAAIAAALKDPKPAN